MKTPTLDNFIRKYGKEEGNKRWKLYTKNKSKFYSQISQELFIQIEKELGNKYTYFYGENEIQLKHEYGVYYYDFYIKELNKIIEFNGDIFHANPKYFKEDECPNPFNKDLTSKEIWEKDKKKLKLLKDNKIDYLIIWEDDYKENPVKELKRCIDFLNLT